MGLRPRPRIGSRYRARHTAPYHEILAIQHPSLNVLDWSYGFMVTLEIVPLPKNLKYCSKILLDPVGVQCTGAWNQLLMFSVTEFILNSKRAAFSPANLNTSRHLQLSAISWYCMLSVIQFQ